AAAAIAFSRSPSKGVRAASSRRFLNLSRSAAVKPSVTAFMSDHVGATNLMTSEAARKAPDAAVAGTAIIAVHTTTSPYAALRNKCNTRREVLHSVAQA